MFKGIDIQMQSCIETMAQNTRYCIEFNMFNFW